MEPTTPRPSAQAIVEHARGAGLRVARVDALSTPAGSKIGRAFGHLVGKFEPNYVERFELHAADGLRWIYVQPYSNQAILPGEHHFPLHGAPGAALWAEGSRWVDRNRRLMLRLAVVACATVIGIPVGILLFVLMIPRAPELQGAPVAAGINRTPQLQRLRYVGGLLARDYIVPWTLQIHSVGGGHSRLICVDPGTVKRGMGILHRGKPSFVDASNLARASQSILPKTPYPAQFPHDEAGWDDVVMPWLDALMESRASDTAEPVLQAMVVTAEKRPGRVLPWLTLLFGLGAIFVGLFFIAAMISMLLNPTGPDDVTSGWCCIAFSTLTLLLPGSAGVFFGVHRLFIRGALTQKGS